MWSDLMVTFPAPSRLLCRGHVDLTAPSSPTVKICQKTVRTLSENCQFLKCVRKQSENYQMSVRKLSAQIQYCVRNVTENRNASENCQVEIQKTLKKSVVTNLTDTFLTHYYFVILVSFIIVPGYANLT